MGDHRLNLGTAFSVDFMRYRDHSTSGVCRSWSIYAGGAIVRVGYRNPCVDDFRQRLFTWLERMILTFRGVVAGWYCAPPPGRDSEDLQKSALDRAANKCSLAHRGSSVKLSARRWSVQECDHCDG